MKTIRLNTAVLAVLVLTSQYVQCEDAGKPEPGTATESRITHVAEGIVRVQVVPKGAAFRQSSLTAVLPDLPAFDGGQQTITVTEKDGVITVMGPDGKPLLTQTEVMFAPSTVNKQAYPSAKVTWRSERPDALFGLGSYQGGNLSLRGQARNMFQENVEDCVPMFFSTAGFGILWDNPGLGSFRAAAQGEFSIFSSCSDLVDYYIITGKTPDDIIAGYRRLTGQAPMLPKWAFGYHQSKERYRTQEQVLGVAKKFRELQFPIDLIIQDWRYWGAHGWNACTFDKENYPDAKAMLKELDDMNIQCIVSVWPSFGDGSKGSPVCQELEKNGMLAKSKYIWGSHQYNAYDPKAREIVWKHTQSGLFDLGVDGWWLDSPETDAGPYDWGSISFPEPFDSIRNAYPFYVVKAFYDGQLKADPSKRFFTLTRSAYAGSQRMGISYWTGDTRGDWDTLNKQIQACLGMSAAGIPYVNHDIGGFAGGNCESQNYRELYLRWFQFGTFTPEMRSHGTRTPREPWNYGNPGETVYDTLLKFTHLRYQLLPYIYSVAWKVTDEGYTMMRPLAMDFPDDASIYNTKDQFMFGPALLVAPVFRPTGAVLDTIPAASLADMKKQDGGLDATYFEDRDLKQPVLTRKDPGVAFAWDQKTRDGIGANVFTDPIPELKNGMRDFSARWEGYIKTDEAGGYTLGVNADDAFRLYVDGRLELDAWSRRGRGAGIAAGTCTLDLPANTLVPIKLEYFQSNYGASVHLNWMKPGRTTTLDVPLPAGANWYDFWTGALHTGANTYAMPAPLTSMPLFVRAGSIVPFGPKLQYTGEKTDEPCELRIYPGADATFKLYNDAGDGYGYEKGERAIVSLNWDEDSSTLTIGTRQGSYPGMAETESFVVRLLQRDGAWKDIPVSYTGQEKVCRFK